ncbi:MAG TPA: tetratricopeptide repeat protein, partial [bacterium]|nr:tetratricopeptide repeat protein [bacterium]
SYVLLGMIQEQGLAGAPDQGKAFGYYLKAAGQGDVAGELKLGYAYEMGRGADRDEAQALHWYGLAAQQGDSHAQLMEGLFLWTGTGCQADHAQGLEWMRKAADQGNELAQKDLKYFEATGAGATLTQEELGSGMVERDKGQAPADGYAFHARGAINGTYRLELSYNLDQGRVTGVYHYLRHKGQPPLRLRGTLDHEGRLHLDESDSQGAGTGSFNGRKMDDGRLMGTWSDPNGSKTMDFDLQPW